MAEGEPTADWGASADQISEEHRLLRAAMDAAVEPWALFKAVRDPGGQVIDFIYRDINRAAAMQQRLRREDLLGRSVAETLPEVVRVGLIEQYAHCVETGEPLVLDDLPYHGRTLDSQEPQTHRYEVRGVRVETDYLSLNWRDTNQRHTANQNVVQARDMLRASADAMLDPQVLLEAVRDPDGSVVDFAYRSVNRAACAYMRMTTDELVGHTQLEITPDIGATDLHRRYIQCLDDGQPVILTDFSYVTAARDDERRYDVRATRAGDDLICVTWSDVTETFTTVQRLAASEEQYRLLAENSTDIVCHIRDGKPVWMSPSVETVLGAPPEYWLGREVFAHVPPEDVAEQASLMATVAGGGAIRHRVRGFGADGVQHWFDLHAKPFYDADGNQDGVAATLRLVDDEVATEQQVLDARRQQARSDALYRRSMDSAAVGMCLADLEGNFVEVNPALCEFFGYDTETLTRMTWQALTAADYLEADLANRAEMLAGRSESYRIVKKFIHANGHPIWGDLAVSCLRAADGQVEIFIGQITDVTAEIQAREQLVASEEHNRALARGLQSELGSAARYLQAVLPGDLDGQVSVSTRYLPSHTLGGDCFDYVWIDDDHLIVYLLDVSGHGVESALVAVSVHNMLRSASLPTETLLEPDRVLTMLNDQFAMERHDLNYFTIFYGVYQPSTGTLRYAGGGHPPALLFTGADATELPSQSPPVGMFDHITFSTTTVPVPPGSQLLVYSDGAYGLRLDDGTWWSHEKFVDMCTSSAGSLDWSLDDLVESLRRNSIAGVFDDDCCLVRLQFD